MATFIKVDNRAAAVIVIVGGLAIWAVVAPESFGSAVDTLFGAIGGAIEGAQQGASG